MSATAAVSVISKTRLLGSMPECPTPCSIVSMSCWSPIESPEWLTSIGAGRRSRSSSERMEKQLPALALAQALRAQPRFWEHVDDVRAGAAASRLARQYIRRDQGRRRALVAFIRLSDSSPTSPRS